MPQLDKGNLFMSRLMRYIKIDFLLQPLPLISPEPHRQSLGDRESDVSMLMRFCVVIFLSVFGVTGQFLIPL